MNIKNSNDSTRYLYTASKDVDHFFDEILSYPPEKRNDKWSVAWADLMMTMFIFFAVL